MNYDDFLYAQSILIREKIQRQRLSFTNYRKFLLINENKKIDADKNNVLDFCYKSPFKAFLIIFFLLGFSSKIFSLKNLFILIKHKIYR